MLTHCVLLMDQKTVHVITRTTENPNLGGSQGPMDTAASFYGDVARSVLYMEIRYNGLAVIDGYPVSDHLTQAN